MQAALHVLRYLKGEPSIGILINNSPTFDLLAYCDANWGFCPHTGRSISGYVVFFGSTLIAWKPIKQVIVSLSSASIRRLVAELS